jgi:16S rRNA (guanine966-N2)-methyltransferase
LGAYILHKIAIKRRMRISGGVARGVVLRVGGDLRPATDFLREAVFSSLGSLVRGAVALDLFAGVGCYGLEALSRGANGCVFVERDATSVDALTENVKRVRKSAGRDFAVKICRRDVFRWMENCDGAFDLIFIDPPYAMAEPRGVEILTGTAKLLRPSVGARIVFEMPAPCVVDGVDGLVCLRRLGRSGHSTHPNASIYGPG